MNLRQRVSVCTPRHFREQKRALHRTHRYPAKLPQTEQNFRGLHVVGGLEAAVRYDGRSGGHSSKEFSLTNCANDRGPEPPLLSCSAAAPLVLRLFTGVLPLAFDFLPLPGIQNESPPSSSSGNWNSVSSAPPWPLAVALASGRAVSFSRASNRALTACFLSVSLTLPMRSDTFLARPPRLRSTTAEGPVVVGSIFDAHRLSVT